MNSWFSLAPSCMGSTASLVCLKWSDQAQEKRGNFTKTVYTYLHMCHWSQWCPTTYKLKQPILLTLVSFQPTFLSLEELFLFSFITAGVITFLPNTNFFTFHEKGQARIIWDRSWMIKKHLDNICDKIKLTELCIPLSSGDQMRQKFPTVKLSRVS